MAVHMHPKVARACHTTVDGNNPVAHPGLAADLAG